MSDQKREAPYTRLKRIAQEFAQTVKYPRRRIMFDITDAKNATRTWRIYDLYERVGAAEQLGWEVKLSTKGDDLRVEYVEARPDVPWELL